MGVITEMILRLVIKDGKLSKASQEVFDENISRLQDGNYDNRAKRTKAGYERPNRYKYYWTGFLPSLFDKMHTRYWLLGKDGAKRNPVDLPEFHYCIRCEFCRRPIINLVTNEVMIVPLSTTELSDNDFISHYQEQIAGLAVNEYAIEIEMYHDWRGRYELKNTSKELKKELLGLLKAEESDSNIKKFFRGLNHKITSYAIDYARQKVGIQI